MYTIQYAKQNNPLSKLKSWHIQQRDKTLLFWVRNKTRPSLLYTLYWKFEIRSIYSKKWNWAAFFSISTFMNLGAIYIFSWCVLFGIYFSLYYVRELSAQPQERREGQGTAARHRLRAVPCHPLPSCGWAESSHTWPTYKFPIWKVTDHKWKQLFLVVNFLFSLRVNEIQNKTFILDSHRPFICSAFKI